jgi:hypothetical protein
MAGVDWKPTRRTKEHASANERRFAEWHGRNMWLGFLAPADRIQAS